MRAANCMRDYGTTNNTPAHQAPPVWRAPEGLEDLTAAQVGDGGACQHTNDKPDRSGAPRGLRGLAGHHTDTPTDWRPPRGLRGLAGLRDDAPSEARGADGERAGRPRAARRSGGGKRSGWGGCGAGGRWQGQGGPRDRALRAKLACGDLAGGPPPTGTHSGPAQQNKPRGGRAWPGIEPTRRAPSAAKAQLVWRTPEGPAAVPVGGGRAWPGFEIDHSERRSCVAISRAGRRPPAPTRRHKHSATNT